MSKINDVFVKLKENQDKALVGYVTAGDPNLQELPKIIKTLEQGGVDIIEVGVPFSDPLADGPVIQQAGQRALQNGFSLLKMFETLETIRPITDVPLVLMVYYNTIFRFGEERFINHCVQCGINGIIIPDLPFEEQDGFVAHLENTEIALIPIVTPVSGARIEKVVQKAKGFVYCVTSLGVTGVRKDFKTDIEQYINEVRKYTDLPLCLGFGIGDAARAKEFSQYADGIIVGSVIVDKVAAISRGESTYEELESFLKGLDEAVKIC